jgi:hypothetical protein
LPSNLGHAFRAKTNNSGGAARTIDLSYGIGKLVSTLLDDGFGWMAIRRPTRPFTPSLAVNGYQPHGHMSNGMTTETMVTKNHRFLK